MEVAALEQTLRVSPDDPAAWRAYGDWLRAQGDARCELIRLELRRRHDGTAPHPDVERKIAALMREHQKSWDATLPPEVTVRKRRYGFATKVALPWTDEAPALIGRVLRERFVTALQIEPDTEAEHEDEEWDDAFDDDGVPVRRSPVSSGGLAVLDLSRLTELDLSYLRIGEPGAIALAVSTTVGPIEALDLRYCGIGDTGLAALAAAAHFRGVRRLHLQSNALTAEGVRALHRFERLTELDLRYNAIGEEGVDALLAAPFAGSLRRLLLNRTDVSAAGVHKLARSRQLPPALRSYWRSV